MLQASPFASEFAATVKAFYKGVYGLDRVSAIRMAYAEYPTGQKLYRGELEQIAQILGTTLSGETAQNWALLLQQCIGGHVIPVPPCSAGETVHPVSRVCVAPEPVLPVAPEPVLPHVVIPDLTHHVAAGAGNGNGMLIVLAAAAIALMIVLDR